MSHGFVAIIIMAAEELESAESEFEWSFDNSFCVFFVAASW